MLYFIIFLCISNLISIFLIIKEKEKRKKEKEKNQAMAQEMASQIFEQLYATNKKKVEDELAQWKVNQENIIYADLEKSERIAKLQKEFLQNEIQAQKDQLDILKQSQEETLKEHKEKIENRMAEELNDKLSREFEEITDEIYAYMEANEQTKTIAQDELQKIMDQLADYKKKRDAVNAEIMRQRKIEESEDFYKINLDAASLHDLALLDEIKPQFSKFDLIQKLEYDNYINKPAQEMVKRILNGKSPCGVYKITRLKTGEVYIGKSTNIKDRWIQHCKSCYHCGTISYSTFHKTLEKDGIQNFTWEVLEEVPKDKLTEREKYWIEFYDSKNYGMNEKVG